MSNKIKRKKIWLWPKYVRLRPVLIIIIYLKCVSNLKQKGIRGPYPSLNHAMSPTLPFTLKSTVALDGLNELLEKVIAWKKEVLAKEAGKKETESLMG